jgi:hypothetical protein
MEYHFLENILFRNFTPVDANCKTNAVVSSESRTVHFPIAALARDQRLLIAAALGFSTIVVAHRNPATASLAFTLFLQWT